MSIKKLPKSARKFIRKEKARIRREFLDITEQEKQIQELYKRLLIDKKRNHSLKTKKRRAVE